MHPPDTCTATNLTGLALCSGTLTLRASLFIKTHVAISAKDLGEVRDAFLASVGLWHDYDLASILVEGTLPRLPGHRYITTKFTIVIKDQPVQNLERISARFREKPKFYAEFQRVMSENPFSDLLIDDHCIFIGSLQVVQQASVEPANSATPQASEISQSRSFAGLTSSGRGSATLPTGKWTEDSRNKKMMIIFFVCLILGLGFPFYRCKVCLAKCSASLNAHERYSAGDPEAGHALQTRRQSPRGEKVRLGGDSRRGSARKRSLGDREDERDHISY